MASANLCNSGSPSSKTRSSLQGPVAIFWDIEKCCVPSDIHPEDVAGNIRLALQTYLIIDGAITGFSAYGDFNTFPRRLREGCQRTGVKLVDVPYGRKDAGDKAILVDMFLFALDNRPPSSIMLISGNVDFAPVLHILGQRGYTIILVIPSGVGISSALSSAGRFLWDWPSMARGKEFVTQPKISSPHTDISRFPCECQTNETIRTPTNEEEGAIAYEGILKSNYNTNDSFMISESVIEHNDSSISLLNKPSISRLHTSPSGLNEVSTTLPTFSDQKKVQLGDLNQLKGQLVNLLELSGGHLPLSQIYARYLTTYGKPLCTAEYGASKLKDLLRKMTDTLTFEGKILKKCVCDSKLTQDSSSLNKVSETKPASSHQEKVQLGDLNHLKGQLVRLLELSEGHLLLSQIHGQYLKTYGRPLCTAEYGASELKDLLRKMTDKLTVEGEVLKKCVCNSKFSSDYSGLNKVSVTTPASAHWEKVQLRDLNCLKGQLVKLLELSGGYLLLSQIHGQYLKTYGKPLCMVEYGASELKDLLEKMTDKLTVEGQVLKKCVCGSKFSPHSSGLSKVSEIKPSSSHQEKVQPGDLNHLKGQLVKLLELSGGHLLLSQIHVQYLRTYGRPLCTAEYGVSKLKDLLRMMTDKLTVEGEVLKKCVSNSKFSLDSSSLNKVSGKKPASSHWEKVQPGDQNRLKGQLLKLLELSGGHLPLSHIHGQYLKTYGRPLCVAEYDGASELKDLLGKMTDELTVKGEILKKCVCNSKFSPDSSGLKKVSGKEPASGHWEKVQPGNLNRLKGQLVKLLELSRGHLLLSQIHGQYLKTYGRPLCMAKYGASELKDLLGKMTDKLTIEGEVLKKCVCNSKLSPDSSGLNKVSEIKPASSHQENVQPGDLNHLKGQLVKLLELSGGHLLLSQIHGQYMKIYERPLCMAGYGASELKDLLGKMTDRLTIEGEVLKKCVCTPDSSGLGKVSETKSTSSQSKKVQPEDLNHLKGQLVKLLNRCCCFPL